MTILDYNFPFTLNELLNALTLIVAFVIMGMVFSYIIKHFFVKWAAKSETELDDILVDKIKPPFSYIIWFLGLKIALRPLHLNYDLADKVVNSIILLIITYIIVVIVDIIIKGVFGKLAAKTESTLDDALLPLADKTIKIVLWLGGLMAVLSVWSLNIGPMLGGLGIAGLALGFAIKDSLANIFGGVSLILDRTIKVGDRVKLESGEQGNVVDMSLRSTRLRTFNNEIIIVPNGQLANSRVQNFGQPDPSLRVVIDFGVGYESDVDLVRKTVLEVIKNMEDIMEDPVAEVLFLSMEDYYLKFSARFWVKNYEHGWDKKLEATDKIFRALKEAKIEIPFPIQTINLKK